MKKTVNINLAGTFFHIDEDAYGKLQRYLAAIKKSLTEPQGSDEIMRDIETRISELFSEKVENSSQVISLKELDEVIKVMGQPEDYMVDEELFEDEPIKNNNRKNYASSTSYKQLFRDVDNKFISGVSAGLGHYLGIDALWVRLLWIVLTFFTSGTFIIVYILFWILVPAATTTSEKLKMTGEAVNISNIEKKFKEGYETVADKVKNADYDKYGQQVKSGASGFFDTLGNILLTILKIFVKFFGILLIITSLATLVSLIIGLFTFGSVDFWGNGELMDFIGAFTDSSYPIWLVSLCIFFAVGIPFFVLLVLGLKMLISNLKSIGTTAKIVLLITWFASIIGLGIFGIKIANEQAFDGDTVTEMTLPIRAADTLNIKMVGNNNYATYFYRTGDVKFKYNENDEKVLYTNNIRLVVKSTTDSVAKLVVEKHAQGNSFDAARNFAEQIDYNYSYANGTLSLDGYLTSAYQNKYRDQQINLTIYMPVGSILYADRNTYTYHRNSSWYDDILTNGQEEQYLRIERDKTVCLDCPVKKNSTSENNYGKRRTSNGWEDEVNRELKEVENEVKKELDNLNNEVETIIEDVNTNVNNTIDDIIDNNL